jgi:nicotinamide mononucleotide transporter
MTDIAVWLSARGTSLLEVCGVVTGLLNVWLTVRQRLWAWPIGIGNALLYLFIFARAGLYSDTGLQVVYATLSAYGWWHWARGGPSLDTLPVRRAGGRELLGGTFAFAGAWSVLTLVTRQLPGAALPAVDAALVASSLVAQWLMTRKRLECWPLWIVINVGYVGLFLTRGLTLTAVLYGTYGVLAIIGFVQWTNAWTVSRTAQSASS